MDIVKPILEGFSILAENSLEEYRAESFFTKEPETVAWIDSFEKGKVFFDVGANIGIYALYASAIKQTSTFAFEPYYKNYRRLIENIKLNKISDSCQPFLCGLSEKTRLDSFFVVEERASSSGHQIGAAKDEYGKSFDPVMQYPLFTYSMDDFIRVFNVPAPNHIKIDVDGLEPKIIEGMENTLQGDNLQSMCIELNMSSELKQKQIDNFKSLGFSIDNEFNNLPNHSRHRRSMKNEGWCENIIFTKK